LNSGRSGFLPDVVEQGRTAAIIRLPVNNGLRSLDIHVRGLCEGNSVSAVGARQSSAHDRGDSFAASRPRMTKEYDTCPRTELHPSDAVYWNDRYSML